MLGPLPLATALGLGGVHAELRVTAALGRNGNTLVLGGALGDALARAPFPLPPAAFARALRDRTEAGRPPPVLAVVYPFSSHNYLLRHWLAEGGIDPDRDLRLVVVPPPEMPEALASRAIDGFCVGEPWGSRAVDLLAGRIVTTTSAIWADHPEKMFAVPETLLNRDPARAEAATAAVIEAANWLSFPDNRLEAAHILHTRAMKGVPEEVIALALLEKLQRGPDQPPQPIPRAIVHGAAASFPDPAQAVWFFGAMRRWGHVAVDTPMPTRVWRPDVWRRAAAAAGFRGLADAAEVFAETLPMTRSA